MIDINEVGDFTEIVNKILATLPTDTLMIRCKIVREHNENSTIGYMCTNNLYEWLNDIIQANDCKNGCQYDEIKHEFLINGSLHYLPRKKYSVMDCIRITFEKES